MRPVAVRLPGVPETRRRAFRCAVFATGGMCKTHWLNNAIKLLTWGIKKNSTWVLPA